jgi:dipeptidase E
MKQMSKRGKTMIAFLTSSPCVINAPRAILNPENGFLDNLRSCLPDHPHCLFVCSDPDSYGLTENFARDFDEAFREAELAFAKYDILDGRNRDAAQQLIWRSDLIILMGGHVPTQNRFFQEIGLRELLENYQGVLMGIRAGSMNSAERVYMQPEESGESAPEFQRFAPGLGITDVNMLPHYQQVRDYMLDGLRLFEDVTYADSMGECFFACVDGTYLLVEEGVTTLYGEAYRIQDGICEQISESGDIVMFEEY